jgi:hypothetical protein
MGKGAGRELTSHRSDIAAPCPRVSVAARWTSGRARRVGTALLTSVPKGENLSSRLCPPYERPAATIGARR